MTTLDEDYLTEHARAQQAAAARTANDHNDRCTTCRHRWHGLQCTTSGCGCASSYVEESP